MPLPPAVFCFSPCAPIHLLRALVLVPSSMAAALQLSGARSPSLPALCVLLPPWLLRVMCPAPFSAYARLSRFPARPAFCSRSSLRAKLRARSFLVRPPMCGRVGRRSRHPSPLVKPSIWYVAIGSLHDCAQPAAGLRTQPVSEFVCSLSVSSPHNCQGYLQIAVLTAPWAFPHVLHSSPVKRLLGGGTQ